MLDPTTIKKYQTYLPTTFSQVEGKPFSLQVGESPMVSNTVRVLVTPSPGYCKKNQPVLAKTRTTPKFQLPIIVRYLLLRVFSSEKRPKSGECGSKFSLKLNDNYIVANLEEDSSQVTNLRPVSIKTRARKEPLLFPTVSSFIRKSL